MGVYVAHVRRVRPLHAEQRVTHGYNHLRDYVYVISRKKVYILCHSARHGIFHGDYAVFRPALLDRTEYIFKCGAFQQLSFCEF